ncbi:hypothetical protein [Bordetella genomosp. 1]|uniref:Uncharacterized protein n=1 Tax=Bordetella genomosp. 1 TaxID=1395607 RepID=A0ABX4F5U6_9BORD|nr:hypothetical protein [Bordetella genomosp. 1]OZI69135.1 hypothetical protein CAL27_06750 [Bordetella genomosp. 1]
MRTLTLPLAGITRDAPSGRAGTRHHGGTDRTDTRAGVGDHAGDHPAGHVGDRVGDRVGPSPAAPGADRPADADTAPRGTRQALRGRPRSAAASRFAAVATATPFRCM